VLSVVLRKGCAKKQEHPANCHYLRPTTYTNNVQELAMNGIVLFFYGNLVKILLFFKIITLVLGSLEPLSLKRHP
jgi:hypothetical protein